MMIKKSSKNQSGDDKHLSFGQCMKGIVYVYVWCKCFMRYSRHIQNCINSNLKRNWKKSVYKTFRERARKGIGNLLCIKIHKWNISFFT